MFHEIYKRTLPSQHSSMPNRVYMHSHTHMHASYMLSHQYIGPHRHGRWNRWTCLVWLRLCLCLLYTPHLTLPLSANREAPLSSPHDADFTGDVSRCIGAGKIIYENIFKNRPETSTQFARISDNRIKQFQSEYFEAFFFSAILFVNFSGVYEKSIVWPNAEFVAKWRSQIQLRHYYLDEAQVDSDSAAKNLCLRLSLQHKRSDLLFFVRFFFCLFFASLSVRKAVVQSARGRTILPIYLFAYTNTNQSRQRVRTELS